MENFREERLLFHSNVPKGLSSTEASGNIGIQDHYRIASHDFSAINDRIEARTTSLLETNAQLKVRIFNILHDCTNHEYSL